MELKEVLKNLLLEFIKEIQTEVWFGKERELVSRFAFSKLVDAVGLCDAFFSPAQIGIEVRVQQVTGSTKKEVCKDLIIWEYPNQTVWDKENSPLCILEWKHRNKGVFQYDIDWLKAFTRVHERCFGIALNIENDTEYALEAQLIEKGMVTDQDWIKYRS